MSIIKIKKNTEYTLVIWKIEEDMNSLLKQLKPTKQETNEIDRFKNHNRKKQNITSRLILNQLANKKVKLHYSENGIPSCSIFKHISISHSKNYCTVIGSKNNIGIDIQYYKKNILEISPKFINQKEKTTSNGNKETLHFIWCAKEAIYKTLNNPNCSLKEDIYILNLQSNLINSYYKYRAPQCIKYQVEYDKIKNYFIAIAIQKS